MSDQLKVADDLFLIGLDDRTGRHVIAPRILGVGLAGALLTEMLINGSMQIVGDRLRPTDQPPNDAATMRILAHVRSEPHHPLRVWLLFLAQTSIVEVAERLVLARVIDKTQKGSLLRGSTVLYAPAGDKTAAAVAWRPVRLGMRLGAGAHFERGVATFGDAALVVLAHAIGLTRRLLRDAGDDSWAYVEEIHQSLARSYPPMCHLAARVGEIAGAVTFTH